MLQVLLALCLFNIGKLFPTLLSQGNQLGESWACLLQIVSFFIYNIKKYQSSYKEKCNHKILKELCCFAKAGHDQFERKLFSVEIKYYGNKEDSEMVFWNTLHWNIYTTLGAFQRRFFTDLEKERCLILNDHMLVKRHLAMMMKSTRRITAVTRVRIQSAKMAPSCIWNES